MNILEKTFDLGFDKFLKSKYLKVNQADIPYFAMKNLNIRFKPKQLPDRLLLSRERNICFELKNTISRSIPFYNIKQHQIDFLIEFKKYAGDSFFIFAFDNLNYVFLIEIDQFIVMKNSIGKKSVNFNDCLIRKFKELNVIKLKVNFRLDLSVF